MVFLCSSCMYSKISNHLEMLVWYMFDDIMYKLEFIHYYCECFSSPIIYKCHVFCIIVYNPTVCYCWMTYIPCHISVSYTHLRAHETGRNLVCRLLLEKKKKKKYIK